MLRQEQVVLPRVPNRNLQHIPGDFGMPIFGSTFTMLRDPLVFLSKRYKAYGPVNRVSVLFHRGINLLGPDANQYVLLDKEQNFSSFWGWYKSIGQLFAGGLIVRDFSEHRNHRRVMQAAFKKPVMETYLTILDQGVREGIQGWGQKQNFHFYPALKALTLDLAASVFLGEDIGTVVKQVNKAFVDAANATTAAIRYPIPGMLYDRGLKGRAWLEDFFRQRVAEGRRKVTHDMFSVLCHAKSEDGESYTDDEIVQHMVFMMMAAHDTTTSALTSIVYALAKNPQWQNQVREEIQGLHLANLEYNDLDRLHCTELVLKEALRMYPPVSAIPRRAINGFSFAGYDIPANTGVGLFPVFSHYMPEYWSAPTMFDPERFNEQRAEHKQHNFLYLPFGGGAHMCLGMHFANMQVKVVLFHLLKRYQITLSENYHPDFQFFPFPKPKDNLPVALNSLN